MRGHRFFPHMIAGALAVAATLGAQAAPSFARGLPARGRAHLVVRDRAALVLARALRASLRARGMTVLAMAPARVGGRRGYVVTWVRGRTEGRVFVDAASGRVHPVGRRVRMRAGTAPVQGTALNAFLAALESTLAAQNGAPVTAQSEDNGAITVFSLDVGGQTVTVTVNTSGSSGSGAGSTGGGPTVSAPAVSLTAAADAAVATVSSLAIPSLAQPFALSARLYGWQGLGTSDGGDGGDGGFGFGNALFAGVPAYAVVVASSAGGSADVLESAQPASAAGTAGASPQLLAIDTMHGDFQGQGGAPAAPTVSLDQAVSAALGANAGAVPVDVELVDSLYGTAWRVTLVQADGSTAAVYVDASTGAVLSAGPGQGSDGNGGSGPQGSGSGQDNSGSSGD